MMALKTVCKVDQLTCDWLYHREPFITSSEMPGILRRWYWLVELTRGWLSCRICKRRFCSSSEFRHHWFHQHTTVCTRSVYKKPKLPWPDFEVATYRCIICGDFDGPKQ